MFFFYLCRATGFMCRCSVVQVSWIQAQKGEAKKAGILAAVAKVPTLLKKLQASADAAVDARDRAKAKEKDEASFR